MTKSLWSEIYLLKREYVKATVLLVILGGVAVFIKPDFVLLWGMLLPVSIIEREYNIINNRCGKCIDGKTTQIMLGCMNLVLGVVASSVIYIMACRVDMNWLRTVYIPFKDSTKIIISAVVSFVLAVDGGVLYSKFKKENAFVIWTISNCLLSFGAFLIYYKLN